MSLHIELLKTEEDVLKELSRHEKVYNATGSVICGYRCDFPQHAVDVFKANGYNVSENFIDEDVSVTVINKSID